MDSKRLDLNLLVTLEALLSERNVTKAAARLHLSQPAVSAQLNRLREEFDDPLLIPAHRGMTPTAKGLELLGPLRQALDQVRATLGEHRNFDPATASQVIHIACTDYMQATLALEIVADLRATAPGIRVALHHLAIDELESRMARGDVDLALMTPQAAPQSLRARRLFDERYVLIGRRGHPALHDGMSVDQFAELEFVVVSLSGGGFRTSVDDALAALGKTRRVVLSAASFLAVPDAVIRSDLVALAPERLVRRRYEGLILVEPPLHVEGFEVGMVWHERTHTHSVHRWVRERIAGFPV
jgi:DNA-binding transcriptional LysR family regulator